MPVIRGVRSWQSFMSRTRRTLLTTAGLTALLLGASVHVGLAESLGDAVEAALNYHPTVEAAIANRNALKEETREKRSDLFPRLSVSGTGGREFANNSTSRGLSVTRGEGYSWLWEGNVTASQLIFDGQETYRRFDAADARRDSADFDVADVRENLALRTVLTYLDVMRTTESVNRLRAHGTIIDDYVSRIGKMVKEGAADNSMLVQAQDVRAQLQSSLANMEGQLKSSIAAYVDLTGHTPANPMDKPEPRRELLAAAPDEAIVFAGANHPMLKAAEMTEEASRLDAAAERAAWMPDVTGEMSYYKRDLADVIGGEVEDAKATVRMNWGFAAGGAQQARVKKSLYRQEESHARREETRRRIERDIQVAYSDLDTAREQVRVQKERVEINQGLLNAHKAQFEAAKANLLQLLQTENGLFNAKLALMNGEYKLLASEYTILASTGRLQEALNIVPAAAATDAK